MSIKVITVLRSGPEWLPNYVYNFKKGLEKNLTKPFEFICLSDIELTGITTIPLLDIGIGYWSKLQMFRRELGLTEHCLYFDLDTIVKGNIDELIDIINGESFVMLQDPWKPEQSGSGVMWWSGDYSNLWDEYLTKSHEEWHKLYNEHPRFGDQGYIIDRVEHTRFQDLLDEPNWFGKFSKKESKPETKVVIFGGRKRKPWLNLEHPDVIKYWSLN
jgi:hypothetical protein